MRGAATPAYSLKLQAIHVTAYTVGLSAGAALAEQIALSADVIGYKNEVTGLGFSWDRVRKVAGNY